MRLPTATLALLTGLAACSEEGSLRHDGVDYEVRYFLSDYHVELEAIGDDIGPGRATVTGTFLDIRRTDGGAITDDRRAALAIADQYCQSKGLPANPLETVTDYSGDAWLIRNHCGTAYP